MRVSGAVYFLSILCVALLFSAAIVVQHLLMQTKCEPAKHTTGNHQTTTSLRATGLSTTNHQTTTPLTATGPSTTNHQTTTPLTATGPSTTNHQTTTPLTATGPSTTNHQTTTPLTATGPSTTTLPAVSHRLPTDLRPMLYRITLRPLIPSPAVHFPDHWRFTFDGFLQFNFECVRATDKIVLNGDLLELVNQNVSLTNASGSPIGIRAITYNNRRQMYTFQLDTTLEPAGEYNLSVQYYGKLTDDLKGFYRTKYMENGMEKYLAMTQMQPTDARRAVPCMDEPAFKAQFQMTIIHPNDMTAIANGKEIRTDDHGHGWSITYFEPSPKMSSYLLAFAVSSFRHRDVVANTRRQTLVRVWSRPSLYDQTEYAAVAGTRALEFYEYFYNVTFPLDKQDLFAAPELSFGAMENWGLVTYRESDLLYERGVHPPSIKTRVAVVVAHELAHQWFGDLVTMAWWDDLWLNEGFASVIEYRGADEISNYSFAMDSVRILQDQGAMSLDEMPTSHAIYVHVDSPDQINEIFDAISYSKGGSVLNMLNRTLGPVVMQAGLHKYLSEHAFGSAEHRDLWEALQWAVAAHQLIGWDNQLLNVTAFMNRWILQMGFPVVSIRRDSAASQVMASQQRFLVLNSSVPQTSPYGFEWFVPLWYETANLSISDIAWLQPRQTLTINDDAFSASKPWVIFNPGGFGFYRVQYEVDNWNALTRQLLADPTPVDPRGRAQLLGDSMALSRAKMLNYSIALDLTTYLRNETHYTPWASATDELGYIGSMLSLTSDSGYYQKYMLGLASAANQLLPANDSSVPVDNVLFHDLKRLLFAEMCSNGGEDCVTQSLAKFSQFVHDCADSASSGSCNPISANYRRQMYCTAVGALGASAFDFLLAKYANETVSSERISLLAGMSCAKEPWLIIRLVELTSNGVIARAQTQLVYRYLPSNAVAMEVLWNYVAQNWAHLKQLFGHSLFTLAAIVRSATATFNTQQQYDMVNDFIQSHSDLGTARRAFEQRLSAIQSNIVWMDANSRTVINWLRMQAEADN